METIKINNWTINYYYQEREERSSEHQGCDESVFIESVVCNKRNIIGLIDLESLSELVLDHHHDIKIQPLIRL